MSVLEVHKKSIKNEGLRRICGFLIRLLAVAFILFAVFTAVDWWRNNHQLLFNANVLTMDAALPRAEALVIRRGRIGFLGSNQAARDYAPWYYTSRDLSGRTLLPGFVDAHSHFLTTGIQAVTTDLSPGPVDSINSLDALYARLEEVVSQNKVRDSGDWLLGFNYDNTAYPSGQHPDRYRLDAIAPERPVFLRHNSGHMGVGNTAALRQLLGDQADEPLSFIATSLLANPYIGKYPGTDELNGLLQESAAPSLMHFLEQFSVWDYWTMFRASVQSYARSGYTTVQNGTSGRSELKALRWLSGLGLLPQRVITWVSHDRLGDDLLHGKLVPEQFETQRFSISAVKITLDGSPQGYTAWLSEPYHIPPGIDKHYRGSGLYTDARLQALLQAYYLRGWRVAIHANGDAAIDQLLRALQANVSDGLQPSVQRGPHTIVVHAQTVREDQLLKFAQLGVTPTYFANHTYYWGDWHWQRTLGPQRAKRISPLHSTAVKGLRYSVHSDAPVTPPSALQQLWSATERISSSGRVLGPEERVSRMAALRALTIEPAWQNGVDDQVGSLRLGKQADLVELSADPLTITDVRDLRVMRTMVGGRSVFQAINLQ